MAKFYLFIYFINLPGLDPIRAQMAASSTDDDPESDAWRTAQHTIQTLVPVESNIELFGTKELTQEQYEF
jgi:hypothetical protein